MAERILAAWLVLGIVAASNGHLVVPIVCLVSVGLAVVVRGLYL